MRFASWLVCSWFLFAVACDVEQPALSSSEDPLVSGLSIPVVVQPGNSFILDVDASGTFHARFEPSSGFNASAELTISRSGVNVGTNTASAPSVTVENGVESTYGVRLLAVSGGLSGVLHVKNGAHSGGGGGNTGTGAVRLYSETNPNGSAGVLQIQVGNVWGGVCDDSFETVDAQVACRQLGGSLIEFQVGATGPTDQFWLDELGCAGFEQTLGQCNHAGIGNENCSAAEHVFVRCDINDPFNPGDGDLRINGVGLLEILHDGQWLGICDDSFEQSDAEVACRQMGGSFISFQTGQNGGTDAFWLDDLGCSGSESHILSCNHSSFGSENCGASEHVQLLCGGTESDFGSVQINGIGLLEVRHNGLWGAVCDDNFGTEEATVVCRQLGMTLFDFATGQSGVTDVFALDGLDCNGSETHIMQCNPQFGSDDCSSSEHVRVRCQ